MRNTSNKNLRPGGRLYWIKDAARGLMDWTGAAMFGAGAVLLFQGETRQATAFMMTAVVLGLTASNLKGDGR